MMRDKFWAKLKKEERSFSWFHRKYLSESNLSYNTLYKQAKGQELTVMSEDLKNAVRKFEGE